MQHFKKKWYVSKVLLTQNICFAVLPLRYFTATCAVLEKGIFVICIHALHIFCWCCSKPHQYCPCSPIYNRKTKKGCPGLKKCGCFLLRTAPHLSMVFVWYCISAKLKWLRLNCNNRQICLILDKPFKKYWLGLILQMVKVSLYVLNNGWVSPTKELWLANKAAIRLPTVLYCIDWLALCFSCSWYGRTVSPSVSGHSQ